MDKENKVEVIKPGTVIYTSSFPAYGVVAKRENWLRWADEDDAQFFLEGEAEYTMIPILILGDYISSRLVEDESGQKDEAKYVQRWASNNLESHMSLIHNIEALMKNLNQFLSFTRSRYLGQVLSELLYLKKYLENPNTFPDEYRPVSFFKKALG